MSTPFLRLGSAWYPDLWDDAVLAEDLAMMRELGFDTVRVGEFGWSRFEPEEGRYDTAWMSTWLDHAKAAGISAIMCTPTAAPPAWLMHRYPELGFVDPNGYRHGIGGRQAGDYGNPDFQAHSRRITEVVAKALGRHPAVIAWQTDNELRGHQKLSLSPTSLAGWHRWLERRYGTIARLNEAWGTHIWANHYLSFDMVPGPHPLPTYCHTHSLLTEFRRYMNEVAVEFQRQQLEIIRRHSAAPITHNSEDSVDEWDLTRDLDFAGHDCYAGHMPLSSILFRMDCFRRLKPGRRFWVMETDSEGERADGMNPVEWTSNFAMLSYASGAEGVSYWPWRMNRTGAEMGHSGIIHPCGTRSMAWEPARHTSALKRALDPLMCEFEPAPASIAFVRAERNGHYYYIDRIAGLQPNFDFKGRLASHHRTLVDLGAWRDVLYDQAEVDGYRVVVSPYLPYTSPEFLARLLAHLERGGIWIVGPYTGYLTEHHANPMNGLFGDLEVALGLETRVFRPIHKEGVRFADGSRTDAQMHVTGFTPGKGDEVLATYDSPRLDGLAWGLRRQVRGGTVYVLGSEIADDARAALYRRILERERIALHPMPERVVRVPQVARDGRHAWALANSNRGSVTVALPATGVDRLSGAKVGRELVLAGGQNAFVVFDQPVEG